MIFFYLGVTNLVKWLFESRNAFQQGYHSPVLSETKSLRSSMFLFRKVLYVPGRPFGRFVFGRWLHHLLRLPLGILSGGGSGGRKSTINGRI